MRRSVRSLLPTIAVFLASFQAARAGASVEAGTLPTPAHHRGASNGPVRPAAPALRASTFAVGTVAVAVSAMVRRSGQAESAVDTPAEAGRQGDALLLRHRSPRGDVSATDAGHPAAGHTASDPAGVARHPWHGYLAGGEAMARPSKAAAPRRTSGGAYRAASARALGATYLYGTVRARAPCRGSRGA